MTIEELIEFYKDTVEHPQIASLLEELKQYRDMFTTADGIIVKPGDTIWVNGSTSISDAHVRSACTTYDYFGPIPVDHSYSTKEAANQARENWKKG